MAMALVRYRFRGRSSVDFFVFMPLSSPEVVLGAALLAMFLTLNINTGFVTVVIAHVMFTVSYVVVTVKARLEGHGPPHRGGGHGPRGDGMDDVPKDHAADDLSRASPRRRCSRPRSPSTTT